MEDTEERKSSNSYEDDLKVKSRAKRMSIQKFSLSIKPVDSKISLYESLCQKFVKMSSLPTEHFECELYSLCFEYSHKFSALDLQTLCNFHAVIELKKKENKLSSESVNMLNLALRHEIESNPDIFLQYSILKQSIDLLSGLSIKFRIARIYKILYRFQNMIVTLPMIDLKDIKQNYFSLQTIALTYYIQKPPLSNLISIECRSFANLVQEACSHVLEVIGKANDQFNMKIPSIAQVIVHKKPEMQSFFNVEPSGFPQEYQTLNVPHPLKRFLKLSTMDKGIKEIYDAIKSFDMAYRKFEASLFGILIHLNEIKLREYNLRF